MKVKVLSDLHLEFADYDPGEGDVLVLAGDICVASDYLWRGQEVYAERYDSFFRKCVENYNKVFYVIGNHEHYNGYLVDTVALLRENLPKGITLLDNQSEYYEGWHFVGATLWTDFMAGNKESIQTCSEVCNEYNYIWHPGGRENIEPKDIIKENTNTTVWFNQCIQTLNGNVMVITHHAPTFESIESDYVDNDTVGAYASNREGIMAANSNLKVWVHGHIHGSQSYNLHGTNVVCNPRGYSPDGLNPNFQPDHQLNLEDYNETAA